MIATSQAVAEEGEEFWRPVQEAQPYILLVAQKRYPISPLSLLEDECPPTSGRGDCGAPPRISPAPGQEKAI
jgi:hypothetical protein